MWVVRRTASVGTATGEKYYVNTATGESVWERPADFDGIDSEDEGPSEAGAGTPLFESTGTGMPVDEDIQGLEFAEDMGLEAALVQVSIGGRRAEAEREEILAAAAGADRGEAAGARLGCLLQAMQRVGEGAEWAAAVAEGDFYIARAAADCVHPAAHPATALVASELLVLFAELHEDLFRRLVGAEAEAALPVGRLVATARACISTGVDTEDEAMVHAFCVLLYSAFAKGPVVPTEALPGEDIAAVLFAVMSDATEGVFLSSAHALVALSAQFESYGANVVMRLCQERGRAEFLGEAILHTLNTQAYPAQDNQLLQLCLTFVCTLFADPATAHFFFTNDLKVLVDIVLRELTDMPADCDARVDFLQVLRLILELSPWFEQGRYRTEDITSVLSAILEAGEGEGPEAYALTQSTLFDCAALLE